MTEMGEVGRVGVLADLSVSTGASEMRKQRVTKIVNSCSLLSSPSGAGTILHRIILLLFLMRLNRDLERLCNLPKSMRLLSGRAWNQTRVSSTQKPELLSMMR